MRQEWVYCRGMGRLAYCKGDYALISPFKGSVRNETGNELGNLESCLLNNLALDPTQQTEISTHEPQLLESLKEESLTLINGYYDPNTDEE